MVRVRHIVFAVIAAAFTLSLGGCPSPLLARIMDEVARAPFTGTTYTFVTQWGNPHPEWAFSRPVVKTDTAGFIYVADSTFRIRKFNGAGVLQSTVAGVSTQGTEARIYDMAFDAAGSMYVTTNDTNHLQKYDVSGNLLHQWAGTGDTYGIPPLALDDVIGIAVDSSGNIYVVDHAHDRVVKFSSSFAYLNEWKGAGPFGSALSGPTGIAIDSSSNFYVLDTGNNRVVEVDQTAMYVTEWGGVAQYPPATGAPLGSPGGIAFGRTGSTDYIYVADYNNDRIVRFDTDGNFDRTWGDSFTFDRPGSIAVDTAGFVYVAEDRNDDNQGSVKKFDVSTGASTLSATWGGAVGTADGITATPWGIALDPDGTLAVAEVASGRVERFTFDGTFVSKMSVPGAFATGLAVDASGNTYIADASGSRYLVYDASGNQTAAVGTSGSGDGQFDIAIGVALDPSGNIYIADADNERVQVFSSAGYFLRKWGSLGTGNGQFESGAVYGVAVDPAGYVYVSDYVLSRVQKFDLNGTFISTIGTFGSADGQFNAPVGMAVDLVGNLYVCDMMNHRVQKFDSSGNFVTSFGSVGAGNGTFGWPVSVAVGSDGTVAVTDYAGHIVQVFAPQF